MPWLHFFLFTAFLTSCISCQKNQNNNNVVTNDYMIINDMIDETILDVRSAIKRFGFDPVKVPTIHHTVSVDFILSSLTVQLNFTNGIIKGASNFSRAGNFYLQFLPTTLRVHGKVRIDRLYGTFNYSYSTRFYEDNGILNTTVENVTAILEADYLLDQLKIVNPKLKIKNIGLTTVDMKSQAALSFLTNSVTNAVLPFFKDEIANISEDTFLKITKKSIDYANKNMNSIIAQAIWGTIGSLRLGEYKIG